jgi:hypothetical protein
LAINTERFRYRVWFIIDPPGPTAHIPVESIDEGKELLRRLIEEQRDRDEITSNVFGLEEYVTENDKSEWLEWYDEEDRDVMEVLDEERAPSV